MRHRQPGDVGDANVTCVPESEGAGRCRRVHRLRHTGELEEEGLGADPSGTIGGVAAVRSKGSAAFDAVGDKANAAAGAVPGRARSRRAAVGVDRPIDADCAGGSDQDRTAAAAAAGAVLRISGCSAAAAGATHERLDEDVAVHHSSPFAVPRGAIAGRAPGLIRSCPGQPATRPVARFCRIRAALIEAGSAESAGIATGAPRRLVSGRYTGAPGAV